MGPTTRARAAKKRATSQEDEAPEKVLEALRAKKKSKKKTSAKAHDQQPSPVLGSTGGTTTTTAPSPAPEGPTTATATTTMKYAIGTKISIQYPSEKWINGTIDHYRYDADMERTYYHVTYDGTSSYDEFDEAELEAAKARVQEEEQLKAEISDLEAVRVAAKARLGEEISDLQEKQTAAKVRLEEEVSDLEEQVAAKQLKKATGEEYRRLYGEAKELREKQRAARAKFCKKFSDLQEKQTAARARLEGEVSDLDEERPALRGFCDLIHHGVIGKVAEFLDPVSLLHWGHVIDSYCAPPTKESQNLKEALSGHLLERTVLPSAGCTLVNPSLLFQNPNQIGAGEDPTKVDRAKFRLWGERGDDPRWDSNAFYDGLGQDQKEQRHLQWHRKVMMTRAANHGRAFDRQPQCNPIFYLAYGYRGCQDEGYPEIDEANQDSNMQELGAFAGNSMGSLHLLFGTLLTRAVGSANNAGRGCILLGDILYAAESLNIKHTFPVETRYTIHLLDGRTLAPTLQEIAGLDAKFKQLEAGTGSGYYFEGKCTALWEISLLSHEAQVAKAQENIQNHIKAAGEMVEDMEGEVGIDIFESIGCNGDDWGDEEANAWIVAVDRELARTVTQSEHEDYDKLLKQEAISHQERIKPKLESFATNDIPSFQPHIKPALIGDSLKILRACHVALEDDGSGLPDTLISPSASMFLQQLIEDFGLGVAIQPLPVTHERLTVPALCGVVMGRNGTTMVQFRVEGKGEWGHNHTNNNHGETSDQSDSDFSDWDSEEE